MVRNTMSYSLGAAAAATGLNKTSILRAIKTQPGKRSRRDFFFLPICEVSQPGRSPPANIRMPLKTARHSGVALRAVRLSPAFKRASEEHERAVRGSGRRRHSKERLPA